MKKFIITLVMVSVAVSAMFSATPTHVVVWGTSGEVNYFALADRPEVTFRGNELIITMGGNQNDLAIPDVEKFTFSSGPNSIDEIGLTSQVVISFTGDEFGMTGLRPDTRVEFYTTDGRLALAFEADSEGCVSGSVGTLASGIYLIRTETKSFKILKK